jgi:hypothetical protein
MLAGSAIRELYSLPVFTRHSVPDANNLRTSFQILGESQCTRLSPT